VTPPPRIVDLPTEEEKQKAASDASPAAASPAVAPAATVSPPTSASRRVVKVLPESSALSRLVEQCEWLTLLYNDHLFEVRDVRTPMDVPTAGELPRCKHANTRHEAFLLLRQLAQTSKRNFLHLQRMVTEGQQNRESDGLGYTYAPATHKKKPGSYVGLVNQGATWSAMRRPSCQRGRCMTPSDGGLMFRVPMCVCCSVCVVLHVVRAAI